MPFANRLTPNHIGLSFELFPPKTPAGERALLRHIEKLVAFQPAFITCTYGAGGSMQRKTLDIVERVKREFELPVAAHLTCVDATVDDLRAYLVEAQRREIDSIVALRGDPPAGATQFVPAEGGLRHANELVSLIRAEFPQFGIGVAGYPEVHREAPSAEVDLANLKRKVDCGADLVLTQLFYCNDDFFRFRERYEQIGIRVPLIPGVLPVTNLGQIQRITSMCGARLPDDLVSRLSGREDPAWQFQVGVEFAVKQVQGLIDRGIPGVHFYVLNKSQATAAVLESLSLER